MSENKLARLFLLFGLPAFQLFLGSVEEEDGHQVLALGDPPQAGGSPPHSSAGRPRGSCLRGRWREP